MSANGLRWEGAEVESVAFVGSLRLGCQIPELFGGQASCVGEFPPAYTHRVSGRRICVRDGKAQSLAGVQRLRL